MTTIQRIAQVFGWVFVVIAIWGALVTGTSMDADPATAERLWGLFPLNIVHNLVHLALGIWGIAASRSYSRARAYALWAGGIYLVLAVVGVFLPAGLGLVPLGGNDIWLHVLLGVLLLGAALMFARSDAEPVGEGTTRTVMPPEAEGSPGPGAAGTQPRGEAGAEPRAAPRAEPPPEPAPEPGREPGSEPGTGAGGDRTP